MIKEFRDFLMRGNALDLAVGVVIGVAFGAIIQSLVNDLINPILGVLTGGINFEDLFLTISGGSFTTLAEAEAARAVTLNYGRFIGAAVEFVIIGFALFIVVRSISRMMPKKEPVAKEPARTCPECFSEINKKASRCACCTAKLS